MNPETISRQKLLRMALVRYFGAFLALAALFFLPAGTLAYWQAWALPGYHLHPDGFCAGLHAA